MQEIQITWTEIDDVVCDIEDLRFNPEKASEVANKVKLLFAELMDKGDSNAKT